MCVGGERSIKDESLLLYLCVSFFACVHGFWRRRTAGSFLLATTSQIPQGLLAPHPTNLAYPLGVLHHKKETYNTVVEVGEEENDLTASQEIEFYIQEKDKGELDIPSSLAPALPMGLAIPTDWWHSSHCIPSA